MFELGWVQGDAAKKNNRPISLGAFKRTRADTTFQGSRKFNLLHLGINIFFLKHPLMKYCSSFWKIHKVVMHKYDSTTHEIWRAKKWLVWKFWRWVSSTHLCCSTLTKYSILSQAFVLSLGAFLSLLSLFMVGVVVILAVREVVIYFIIWISFKYWPQYILIYWYIWSWP